MKYCSTYVNDMELSHLENGDGYPSKPLATVLANYRLKAKESVSKLEWLYILYE